MSTIEEIIEEIYAAGATPETILRQLTTLKYAHDMKRIIDEFQLDVTYDNNKLINSIDDRVNLIECYKIIEMLLDYGAAPSDKLLLGAACFGSYNLIKRLLESGADPNSDDGMLLGALQNQELQVLKLFLDCGVNIKPIHLWFAGRHCSTERFQLLLNYANPSTFDCIPEGEYQEPYVEKARLLLAYGIPPEVCFTHLTKWRDGSRGY